MKSKKNETLSVIFAALLSAGALAFVLAPVAGAQGSTTGGTINTNLANVSIVSGAQNQNGALFYSPANITVVLGVNNTVVWTNHDSTTHTVVALDNSYMGTLGAGQTFTHTYTAAGVYKYHCTIHLWMTGSVKVLAAPSSSSTTASGSTGGIPEFPFGAAAVTAITVLVLASYLVLRQTKRG